jgi:hypothetical protein
MEHKHAAILRAIADGKDIQYRYVAAGKWWPSDFAEFCRVVGDDAYQFRIKPERISAWLNVYGHMCSDLYDTREAADAGADAGRIACIPVEFDEGDGL